MKKTNKKKSINSFELIPDKKLKKALDMFPKVVKHKEKVAKEKEKIRKNFEKARKEIFG